MKDKYFIKDQQGTTLGPFSLEELRMLWATDENISVDTMYTKETEELDVKTKVSRIKTKEGSLGEIRSLLRPLLKKNEALVDGHKVEKEEAGQTLLKTNKGGAESGGIQVKSEYVDKNRKAQIEEEKIEEEREGAQGKTEIKKELIGMENWGTGKSTLKKTYSKSNKENQRRAVLLVIILLIVGYVLADVYLETKLDGRYVPENSSLSLMRESVSLYIDDLIRVRDYLGVPAEPKTWDQSVIPHFEFKAGVFITTAYMSQGSKELKGRLFYVDPVTAFIRFDDYRGHIYITTLDNWKSFRYFGIEFTPSSF